MFTGDGVVGSDFDPATAGVGTHTVTYEFTDANGCTNSTTTDVVVNDLPECIASNNGPVCMGDDVTLMETGPDAVSWSWTGPGGFTSTDQNPLVSPAVSGTYTVEITDANGCVSTCTTEVVVNALPECIASNNGPVCMGEDITLMETGPDAVSWSWTGPGGFTSTDQNPLVSPAVAGTYTVEITDANGCVSTCTTEVVVNALPECIASNNGPVCMGDDVTLMETGPDLSLIHI